MKETECARVCEIGVFSTQTDHIIAAQIDRLAHKDCRSSRSFQTRRVAWIGEKSDLPEPCFVESSCALDVYVYVRWPSFDASARFGCKFGEFHGRSLTHEPERRTSSH